MPLLSVLLACRRNWWRQSPDQFDLYGRERASPHRCEAARRLLLLLLPQRHLAGRMRRPVMFASSSRESARAIRFFLLSSRQPLQYLFARQTPSPAHPRRSRLLLELRLVRLLQRPLSVAPTSLGTTTARPAFDPTLPTALQDRSDAFRSDGQYVHQLRLCIHTPLLPCWMRLKPAVPPRRPSGRIGGIADRSRSPVDAAATSMVLGEQHYSRCALAAGRLSGSPFLPTLLVTRPSRRSPGSDARTHKTLPTLTRPIRFDPGFSQFRLNLLSFPARDPRRALVCASASACPPFHIYTR